MNGTVRRGADGSVSWHAPGSAVLGPVSFVVGGISVIVDAAAPEQVIDLGARDAASLRDVVAGFADATVVDAILDAEDGGVVPGPVLVDGIARLATVSAVDAIHLGDLDDAVLLLDAAYARAAAGDPDAADHYALAASVPDRIVDEIESADYLGPLLAPLADAIGFAPTGILSVGERNRLLTALRLRTERVDAEWQVLLAIEADSARDLALHLGGIEAVVLQVADLRALPPRLLMFSAPEEAEVEVVANPDGTVEVAAVLRPDIDADTLLADGIFAVAADPGTGDVLAFAPASISDGRLSARIQTPNGPNVRCAFLVSSTDLAALRLDPLGIALTRIDRHCRYAWTRHRTAGAVLAGIGAADQESEIARAAAVAESARQSATEAVDNARMLIRQLARRHRSEPIASALAEYRDAIDSLAESISAPPATDGPTGPTMAELHEVALR